jgi:preprotein translocase subunit YajC
MHGTIETIEDTTVVLRFDDTLKIRFDKSAIVQA